MQVCKVTHYSDERVGEVEAVWSIERDGRKHSSSLLVVFVYFLKPFGIRKTTSAACLYRPGCQIGKLWAAQTFGARFAIIATWHALQSFFSTAHGHPRFKEHICKQNVGCFPARSSDSQFCQIQHLRQIYFQRSMDANRKK